eukprot:693415-Prorocentrum_minimum.AAC.1
MMPNVSLDTLILADNASLPIGAMKRGEPIDLNFANKGIGAAELIILAEALKVFSGSLNALSLS